MLLAQQKPLVVSQACRHPFHVGHKHQIGGAEPRAQQERPRGGKKRLLQGRGKPLELLAPRLFLSGRTARGAQPLAPGAKEQPLQLPQRQHRRIPHGRAEGAEGSLQGLKDAITFRDHAAIQLQGREHARGHQLLEPALLLAVAKHRDLADPVGDPLLLEPQPHLLAVGAPGVVIPIQGDPHLRFGAAKQPQGGLGIGGAVNGIVRPSPIVDGPLKLQPAGRFATGFRGRTFGKGKTHAINAAQPVLGNGAPPMTDLRIRYC